MGNHWGVGTLNPKHPGVPSILLCFCFLFSNLLHWAPHITPLPDPHPPMGGN